MAPTNPIGRDATSGFLTELLLSAASDPTTHVTGSTYYNTVSNTLKVYNGTTWVAVGGSGASTPRAFTFFLS